MSELVKNPGADSSSERPTQAQIRRSNKEHLGTGLTEGTVHRVDVEVFGADDNSRTVQMAEKHSIIQTWMKPPNKQ
ncbi:hypothetical protein HQ487_02550 [Candidatus Uhrbacteria bacterium]|nr:hypothetical protein [Candidatus Uhrbacteria bacterium]